MNAALKNKIKKIKLLIMDVDGVMTNGQIIVDDLGKETKIFDVQDGYGIVLFRDAGYKTAIISARKTNAVTVRVNDLKINKVFQDAYPKTEAFNQVLKELGVSSQEVCFMGDDLPDLCILNRVGLAVAVANAVSDVKKAADYVTKRHGGQGAVREVIELILKTQGKWDSIVKGNQ